MNASSTTDTTHAHMSTSGELTGLHGRLTVIPAGPADRAALTEQLARLVMRARDDALLVRPGTAGLPGAPDDTVDEWFDDLTPFNEGCDLNTVDRPTIDFGDNDILRYIDQATG